MTQEKKVQTAAVMDVTGVERAAQDAINATKRMAEGISREGEKAGKGLEAMGGGAEKAERTVDAKTKSISDRIRRLTQQAQRELAGLAASSAGGPGSASAVEYEASLRGVDVSRIQPQIAALRQLQQQADSLGASMRQALVGDEFIGSINSRITALQRQASAAKMTEADMLALKAAELGVAQQADPLIAKLRQTAAAADEVAAATRRQAAGKDFLGGLSAQAGAIGKTRADLLELKAAELGVTEQAKPMIAAIRAADGELAGMGRSAKATAAALRTVPAQFTDIVVSLQGGQNPFTVLLQQGGQLKDQFGGIGPAAQALGGYVRGLINPFTLAAAAAAVLGGSLLLANDAFAKTQRSMIESGMQAGVTATELQAVGDAIAALGGATSGGALALLTELAKTGDLGAAGLQRYAQAAIEYERAGGQTAEKIVAAFVEIGKAPVQASLKLNESTNFLTASVFSQIKALEDQGRTLDAARVAAEAYASAIESRTPQMEASLNGLERAWRRVREEAKGALDDYLRIFRTETPGEELDRVRKNIAELERAGQKKYTFGPSVTDLREQERNLQEILRLDQKSAERAAGRKRETEAQVRVEKLREETLSKQDKMERELDKYRRDAGTLNIDAEQRIKDEAAIRKKYEEKGGSRKGDGGLAKALLAEQLQDIRSGEQAKQAIYRQSESILEAMRQAGLVSEADYYESKLGFVRLDADAKVTALEAEVALMKRFKGTAQEDAQVRRDIAVAEQKIAQARAEAAGKDVVMRIQQTSAIEAQVRAMRELEFAAAAEMAALQRRLGVQNRQAGMGSRRAGEDAEQEALAADFTRRQAQLDAEYRNGRLRGKEEQYREELNLLINEEGKQLRALEEFQKRKREIEGSAILGAQRGIENVLEDTAKTGQRTQSLIEDSFKGLGDALTDVFTKGKADWASLERSIISGIARIIIEQQLIQPIAKFLNAGLNSATGGSGIFSAVLGSLFGGGRATGGDVQAGRIYQVNESESHGPGEILQAGGKQFLMARQTGVVRPGGASGPAGGGGISANVVQNISVGEGASLNQVRAAMVVAKREAVAEIMKIRVREGT